MRKKKEKPTLYIKMPNGRYSEYKEEVPKYDNALYRRVGKRYEPVSMQMSCDSLPEGVWVVQKYPYSRQYTNGDYLREDVFKLYNAGKLEPVSMAKLGSMNKLVDHLAHHFDEIEWNGRCTYDICGDIVSILFNYETQKDCE